MFFKIYQRDLIVFHRLFLKTVAANIEKTDVPGDVLRDVLIFEGPRSLRKRLGGL